MRRRNPHGGHVSARHGSFGLTRAFEEAGGTGSKVLIRRVWLGRVDSGLVESQRAVYESYAAGSFGADQTDRVR